MFQFGATGCPEHGWSVLTESESTRRFLCGVGLESTWVTGSRIAGRLDRALVMHSEVLFAEYPNRLSYLLAAGPEQPEASVTGEIRACGGGAIVRLFLDEADAAGEEVEAAWQPVVTTLQALPSTP